MNIFSSTAIDCGVLPTPDNAEKVIETHTRVGGLAKFRCKDTYEISGSGTRRCLNSGLWSGIATTCNGKQLII